MTTDEARARAKAHEVIGHIGACAGAPGCSALEDRLTALLVEHARELAEERTQHGRYVTTCKRQFDEKVADLAAATAALGVAQGERDAARATLKANFPVGSPSGIGVREAARKRYTLGGADTQALEGALALTERERDALTRDLAAANERAFTAEATVAGRDLTIQAMRESDEENLGRYMKAVKERNAANKRAQVAEAALSRAELNLLSARASVEYHQLGERNVMAKYDEAVATARAEGERAGRAAAAAPTDAPGGAAAKQVPCPAPSGVGVFSPTVPGGG